MYSNIGLKRKFYRSTSIGKSSYYGYDEITGNIGDAVDRLRKLFNIKAKILPATL